MVDPATATLGTAAAFGVTVWAGKEVVKHGGAMVIRKSASDPQKGKKRAKKFNNAFDCVELLQGSAAAALSLYGRNKCAAGAGIAEESVKQLDFDF